MSGQCLTTDVALFEGLRATGGPACKEVLSDQDAFFYTMRMFNGAIEMLPGGGVNIAYGFAIKAMATADIVSKTSGSKGVQISSAAIQIILSYVPLITLAGKIHPTAALATIGTHFATKVSLVIGVAGGDGKKAKCISALSEMAASGGTIVSGALTPGVGPVIVAWGVASLLIGAYNASQSCKGW